MSARPTWLLFDLGGVLVDFSGPRDLPALLPPGRAATDWKLAMAGCAATDAFERGAIDLPTFAARFVRDWQLATEADQFARLYVDWLRGLYDGVPTLLTRLRAAGYRLACLSNSNAAHWDRSTPMRWLQQQLDVAISSHQLGLRKPDSAIFAVALDRLGAPAEAVGYFDDLPANVAAAAAAGLRAHHVDGIDALHARLAALGWLDD
jgi:putative hydrolase of the HAD superfamily